MRVCNQEVAMYPLNLALLFANASISSCVIAASGAFISSHQFAFALKLLYAWFSYATNDCVFFKILIYISIDVRVFYCLIVS